MSSVIAADACPSIVWTVLTSAAAETASDAVVWRSSGGWRPEGTSAISLTVIWAILGIGLILPAIGAHSRGRASATSLWIGAVALVFLAGLIVRVWPRLLTRYPER